MQWEKKALEELHTNSKAPVGNIHFQDVVPDEIRQLGTSYFQFSSDQEQRAKQMETLQTLRDETMVQRSRRERLKERRKAANEARLAKIRKRKGLAAVPVAKATLTASGSADHQHPEGNAGDGNSDDDGDGDGDGNEVGAGASSVGGSGSLDAFLAEMKEQSKMKTFA